MARDIDAIKIAGIHETRGRQSKAIRARTRTDTLKGFEATSKGLMRSLDFALPLGLFAFTSWSSRLKITVVSGTGFVTLFSPDRATSVYVRLTYQGKGFSEIHFAHPNIALSEGVGMMTLLMSMPGSDLIGLVENGLALAIYHTFLHGGGINIPGTTAGGATGLNTLDLALLFLAGPLGLFLVGTATGGTATRMEFLGMFPSARWTVLELQVNMQREIDAGRMSLPGPGTVEAERVPVDALVRRVQIDAAIKALAHGAFLTLLLKRGGGVVPTE